MSRRPRRAARRSRQGAPRAPAVPAVTGVSSPGGFEHVAGLPHGLDERRAERVELLAQVADVRLDDIGVTAEVVVPDVLKNLSLREHAPWIQHEEPEERKLGRGQRDGRRAAEDLVAALVEREVADAQHVAGEVTGGTA